MDSTDMSQVGVPLLFIPFLNYFFIKSHSLILMIWYHLPLFWSSLPINVFPFAPLFVSISNSPSPFHSPLQPPRPQILVVIPYLIAARFYHMFAIFFVVVLKIDFVGGKFYLGEIFVFGHNNILYTKSVLCCPASIEFFKHFLKFVIAFGLVCRCFGNCPQSCIQSLTTVQILIFIGKWQISCGYKRGTSTAAGNSPTAASIT